MSKQYSPDTLTVTLFAPARCRHFYRHTVKAVLAYDAGTCHTIPSAGIRFSEVEGLKRHEEWSARIRYVPGNAVKSKLNVKKITTPVP